MHPANPFRTAADFEAEVVTHEAIAESAATGGKTVHVQASRSDQSLLEVLCTDGVPGEYWGTDDYGDPWRVHVDG